MLAQFSVENFMSIKDRVVLNLSASKSDDDHPNNFCTVGKTRCLKTTVVYGANASGKSSLLKAMTAAILLVRESQLRQVNDALLRVVPFRFDSETPNLPSAFEFIIFINGTQYIYGFSATTERVVDEYLYVFRSAKRSLVFERHNTDTYKFNKADEREFNDYKMKNTANKLFLATATAWNCKKTVDVFMWFANGVDTYTDDNVNIMPDSLRRLNDSDTPELRDFMSKLLKNADINIHSYSIKTRPLKVPVESIGNESPREITLFDVITEHVFPDDRHYSLNLGAESLGTQNLFCLSPLIYNALLNGKTLFIDEMSCLHSILVVYLVQLFNDPLVNKTNAQLIFATHDTILLDLNVFRRDQIYFIDKNSFGVSDIYSLDNFSVRKKENIRSAYLVGKYGAVPIVRNEGLL